MADREHLQREALEELVSYSGNLVPAVQEMIVELRSAGKEDTEEFLEDIIAGINWEIEVYNQCVSLLNEKGNYIDRSKMGEAVRNLGVSLGAGDRAKIAKCLEEDFLPFLNQLTFAARIVVEG